MTAGIHCAAAQVRRAQLAAGSAYSRQFGMCGGIVGGQDVIDAGSDDCPITGEHCTKRAAALRDVVPSQFYGLLQKAVIVIHVAILSWRLYLLCDKKTGHRPVA